MKNFLKLSIVLFFASIFYPAFSDFISASNTSRNAVQIAIDSAGFGDTVIIPEGESLWTSKVNIPNYKKITLVGAGSRKTIIKSNMPNEVISMNRSGSRITKIGFILLNDNGDGINVRGTNWRIDHCRFANPYNPTIEAVVANALNGSEPHPVGVVDHCEFIETRVVVFGQMDLMAHTRWSEPLGLGTNNAVFVEDNVFTRTHGNAIDANYGGKYVFRHNTLNDCYIEAHAVQGDNRAARSWEIYNNTINQVKQTNLWAPMFLRGGTGVIFNNNITGDWSDLGFALDNRRSCNPLGSGGLCDGSSAWDGNFAGQSGYPCRDQIGRSTDYGSWISNQSQDPAYCWNNTFGGSGSVVFFVHVGSGSCAEVGGHIQQNRDFYNNQPKPGYTPYTYPHPLVTQDDNSPIRIRIK